VKAVFELTEAARLDIAAIRKFTRANWGAAKEDDYVAALFRRLQMIAERPLLGRARPELGDDVRSVLSGSHLVLYRPNDRSGASILRVIHQAQDLPDIR
jgi:toxin ParE1/3/4